MSMSMTTSTPRVGLRISAALALPLAACGNDQAAPDAPQPDSTTRPPMPEPPALGAQIDRMGRPAINTVLVGFLDATTTASMKKDAYNTAADAAMWAGAPVMAGRSIAAEVAANLPLVDVLDKGSMAIPGMTGCHNQMLFNGNVTGGGTPGPTSYSSLAAILADDMLYVDTTKTTCTMYMSLEVEVASAAQLRHTQCGGRTPTHDVIDVSYSLLMAGLTGLTDPPGLRPRLGDGVGAHTDVSESSFPYFGPPH
jgi:hypothetical protein